jgi:hypothetical protein
VALGLGNGYANFEQVTLKTELVLQGNNCRKEIGAFALK